MSYESDIVDTCADGMVATGVMEMMVKADGASVEAVWKYLDESVRSGKFIAFDKGGQVFIKKSEE